MNRQRLKMAMTASLIVALLGAHTTLSEARPAARTQFHWPERLIQAADIQADQTDCFVAILQAQHHKRIQIQRDLRGEPERIRKALADLHHQTVNRLQELLNVEQLAKYDVYVKDRLPAPPHRIYR